MATQIAQPVQIPVQIWGNSVGAKLRDALRKLGMVHMYKRDGKLYTFDIPFELKAPKSGEKIIIVINKANLPRRFPPKYLIEAKDHLEAAVGMPIQILEAANFLAVCCQVPRTAA